MNPALMCWKATVLSLLIRVAISYGPLIRPMITASAKHLSRTFSLMPQAEAGPYQSSSDAAKQMGIGYRVNRLWLLGSKLISMARGFHLEGVRSIRFPAATAD